MPADRKQRALVTFLLEQVVLTASASSLASQRPGDVLTARRDYVPRMHAGKDISFSCGSPPQLLGGRGVTGQKRGDLAPSGQQGAGWLMPSPLCAPGARMVGRVPGPVAMILY